MNYGPEKLSMEKVADAAFIPADRIGALEMQTLGVTDNRALLRHHLDSTARLGEGVEQLAGLLGDAKK
jgi:argininosuccinate synthase